VGRADLTDTEVRHTLPVKWLSTDVLRPALKQDLLTALGRLPTVYRIYQDNAEERFRAAARGGIEGPQGTGGDDSADVVERPDPEQTSKDELLKFIQRKFPRHELADLVAAILRAEGYMTKVSPPGPDGGVDILAGSGPMGFDEPKLCPGQSNGVAGRRDRVARATGYLQAVRRQPGASRLLERLYARGASGGSPGVLFAAALGLQ
jgi:restriction system protein